MSLFGSILKTAIDVVTTPVDVVKDIASLGGTLTDQDESYTVKKLKKLDKDLKDISDDAGKL
jgi:hypothetical protein